MGRFCCARCKPRRENESIAFRRAPSILGVALVADLLLDPVGQAAALGFRHLPRPLQEGNAERYAGLGSDSAMNALALEGILASLGQRPAWLFRGNAPASSQPGASPQEMDSKRYSAPTARPIRNAADVPACGMMDRAVGPWWLLRMVSWGDALVFIRKFGNVFRGLRAELKISGNKSVRVGNGRFNWVCVTARTHA